MELNEVTLEVSNPQLVNIDAKDREALSEIVLCYNKKEAMHMVFYINPKNNKPSLKIKFITMPIHNFHIEMKQVFLDGRTKTLDVGDIPSEKIIKNDEHLYIKKNSLKDLDPGIDYRFVCNVKLTPAVEMVSNNFSKDTFENLIKVARDKKFIDFIIKFKDGKELKVIKFFLATKSSVFLKIFTADMIESKKNEMFISDIKFEVMRIAVNFMYNRCTKGLASHIFDVLIVADKYEISELKTYCELQIAKGLTTEIVADVLIFADRYNAKLLKHQCILFIQRNWDAFNNTEGFKCICTYSNLILDIFETFSISRYPIKSIISNL